MANEWKSKISAIFAEQGDIVEIPVETQVDNQVSFATGYTKNYNKDAKDDLGNPLVKFGIERTKFNYLFKIITSAIKELQEIIPVYTTDTDEQKVDVGAIIENTTAFNALTDLLCIDDTGKASKITKEELIAQLNPNIDLSNNNISVTEIADTALNNFLAIDGTTVKKANKLLQEVIEEIDLSADNVKVTKETTYTDNHKILVVNSAGATHKVDKLLQSAIDDINLSADNISVAHINTGTTTLKPLMVDENGKITSEDNISSDLIKGNIFAKGLKTIVMTKEQYPNGIDDLTITGLYSLASMDEYKDIVNDSLPSERKEYIKKVLGQILTLFNYSNEQITNLDISKFSDLIYCPTHQIQVVGISQGETDNTIIQQSFILFGMTLGTRTGTMTLNNTEFNNVIKMNGLPYVPIDIDLSQDNVKVSKTITQTAVNTLLVTDTAGRTFKISKFDFIAENAKLSELSKDIQYNVIEEDNPITDVLELPLGYHLLKKELTNEPKYSFRIYGYPVIYKQKKYGQFLYLAYQNINGRFENSNLYFIGNQVRNTIVWEQANFFDLSITTTVSEETTNSAVNTLLCTNEQGKIVKVEKNNIVDGIVSEVNAGIDLADYYTKTETDDKLNDYATNTDLTNGLNNKQDKGNYFNRDTDTIETSDIANQAITSKKLAPSAVTNDVLAASSVDSFILAKEAVQDYHIANNTITGAKLENKTITAKQIADNTITANQLAPNSVGRDELGSTYAQGVAYTDIENLFAVFGLQKPVTTAQLVEKMCTNMIESRKAFFQTSFVWNDTITDIPANPVFLTIIYIDGNSLVLEARAPFGNKALWVGSTNGNNFTGWTKVRGDDGLIYPGNINMGVLMGYMFRIGGNTVNDNSGIGSWSIQTGGDKLSQNGTYFNVRFPKDSNVPTFVWVNSGGDIPSNSNDVLLVCKLS